MVGVEVEWVALVKKCLMLVVKLVLGSYDHKN